MVKVKTFVRYYFLMIIDPCLIVAKEFLTNALITSSTQLLITTPLYSHESILKFFITTLILFCLESINRELFLPAEALLSSSNLTGSNLSKDDLCTKLFLRPLSFFSSILDCIWGASWVLIFFYAFNCIFFSESYLLNLIKFSFMRIIFWLESALLTKLDLGLSNFSLFSIGLKICTFFRIFF